MERGKKRLEKLRRRREAAVKLFEQGARQATVAHSLRASRQSVSEWWLAWRAGDTKKLKGATEAGRRPRVQPEQLKLVEKELLRGARAHGYETDLWSLPRIASLIPTTSIPEILTTLRRGQNGKESTTIRTFPWATRCSR